MKKIISAALTFTLLLSVIVVFADGNVQKLYGCLTSITDNGYIITAESGETITADAAEGLDLFLGMNAWFTVETRTGEHGDYLCITACETIPEIGEEVGYLCSVSVDWSTVGIYTDKLTEFDISGTVKVNGEDVYATDALNILKNYQGAVSYRTSGNYIRHITFITEPKASIKDQKYNAEKHTFNGLEYSITENTNVLYMKNGENKFTGFDPEYTYSFDVLSYDKDKNARLIIITDMYKYGMELYISNSYSCYTKDENGNTNHWNYSDSSLFDNVSANSMIEFTYDENNTIKSVTTLEGTDFQGYTYDKDNNTFGGCKLSDVSLVTVEFNERAYIITYTPFVPDDKLQYSGQIYTSSYGKRVLWITDSKKAAGAPIIDFWARDTGYGLKFGATYDKNGYTGGGAIYLALYYQDRLTDIYTYSLTDEGSEYDEDGELTSVIDARYMYGYSDYIGDYTVKGFVWDNLTPMSPAVPVWD